jgi:hypothetical protein
MAGIEAGDVAVADNANQAVGGQQQAGLCQSHAELIGVHRQQQIQYGVGRQRQRQGQGGKT